MVKIWEFESAVTGIDNLADSGRIIARIIRLERKQDFDFKPGQFVMITHPGYDPGENWNRQLWRPYSICSSPLQDGIELCFSVKEPPSFTSFLNDNIEAGSIIKMKGPYGGFFLKDDCDEIILIAAGTGIAPLMSMIRTLHISGDSRPVKLFYGYRNSSQFYYGRELQALCNESKNFKLFTIASREGPDPGHVQRLLETSEFDENKERTDIYICGPPKMVDDAKEIMEREGFQKARIHAERYD